MPRQLGRLIAATDAEACIHGVWLFGQCTACMIGSTPQATDLPPAPQDEHAYIFDMMGDASVLSDRMEYDPAAMEGIVGRLINAITILSDQNKALADRVERLTTRVDAQNRIIQRLAGDAS